MTLSLVIVTAILGTWIIFHNNKSIGPSLNKLAILALLFQVVFRYATSFSTEMALFDLAKDAFVLSTISALLIITKKNIFAQLGILFASVYFLNSQVQNDTHPLPSQEIDPQAELLIKTYKGAVSSSLEDLMQYYSIGLKRSFNPVDEEDTELDDYFTLDIPDENHYNIEKIFRELNQLDEVEWVEYNEKLYRFPLKPGNTISGKTLININDPLTSQQWSLQAMHMDDYYFNFKNQSLSPTTRCKLFILDSGIDSEHEDLKDVYVRGKSKNNRDSRGHGTHCAGIAAAASDNGIGIASMSPGVDWVSLYSIKVINDLGFGTQKSIIDGIIEAVDNGADVINMSLGGKAFQKKETAYEEAVKYANDHNTIIVVAAGNSNESAKNFLPAKLDGVITVAAVNNQLNRAFFSNYVNEISYGISAPGTDILSTFTEGSYEPKSGTSMASPHVAGLIAVMKSLKPSLKMKEAYDILNNTGIKTGDTRATGKFIQPNDAINSLLSQGIADM